MTDQLAEPGSGSGSRSRGPGGFDATGFSSVAFDGDLPGLPDVAGGPEGGGGPSGAEPVPPMVPVAWALVPKVNLLPVEILEQRRFRRTQAGLAAGLVVAVVLVLLCTLWAQHGVSDARDQLSASEAQVSTLRAQQSQYATVPQVIAQVEAAGAARSTALASDVLWYRILNNLDGARPAGVALTSVAITLNGGAGGTATLLTPTGIGSIQIDGTADSYSQVSSWLEAVNKVPGLSFPTLSTVSQSGSGLSFSSTVVVDSSALSGRYQKKAS